jgi:hypothetical protein
LEVHPPKLDDRAPREERLTGERALHFVRAHLGIRWGQLVLIKHCWRGDGSLGIKRSRYSVVPPSGGNLMPDLAATGAALPAPAP